MGGKMTIRKIKIVDNDEIRNKIDKIYEEQNQVILAKWSLEMAKHIIEITNLDINKYPEINEGFKINELWQNNQARMFDVRQVGFKIHRIAREQNDEVIKNVFRVIGQAIGSGHMKEHSMVASDYAIKVINLMYSNNIDKVNKERNWQLKKLIELIKNK